MAYDTARYYDPNLGRFISADTVVPGAGSLTVSPNDPVAAGAWSQRGAATDPQQLNRYSYASNNPVRNTDPSGHCFGVLGGIDTLLCVGAVVLVAGAIAAVAASPNSGFNPNDYNWSDWSLPGLPIGTSAAQPLPTTSGIPLTGEEKGSNINAAKQSKQSGKEGATDIPRWAKGQKALPGETPQTTAKRLMDEKYGEGEWDDRKGPGQEFNKLKKYYERNRNAGGSNGGGQEIKPYLSHKVHKEKRMSVFVLQHVHNLDEEREDIKLIGVYSSQEEAEKAITRMRLQPGFCETPEGFAISKIILNKDYWEEGYLTTEGDNDVDKE